MQNFNSIAPFVSEIWIFKLILICKFENVPCALGFEVKHSKFFCMNFRARIIYLSWNQYLKVLYILNYYGQNNLFIMNSTFKIIIQVLKVVQKNFDYFASRPNAHGTFSNLHIKINLKIVRN